MAALASGAARRSGLPQAEVWLNVWNKMPWFDIFDRRRGKKTWRWTENFSVDVWDKLWALCALFHLHPEFEIYHLWGVYTEKHHVVLLVFFFQILSHTDTPRSFRKIVFFVSQIIIRMLQVADHDEEDSIDRVIRTWPGPQKYLPHGLAPVEQWKKAPGLLHRKAY